MKTRRHSSIMFAMFLVVAATTGILSVGQSSGGGELAGTSWELVKFEGGDGKTLVPDEKSKYTIAFDPDGGVSVRIDCNRGHGTWKSSGPNQIEFGPLALTRAMCPPAPLNDRMARDWAYVRSYILRDGHLFLSLMADGGIYEFEPLMTEGQQSGKISGTATYRERMALPPRAVFEATLEDTSRADTPSEVIGRVEVERPFNPPIPFEISYDVTKIQEGHAYAVRARITSGEQLMFTTTQNYPVLTRGNGNEVTLMLQRTSGSDQKGDAAADPGIAGLPATFVGTIPCADCPGIRYQVNLLPDHTYVSRLTYLERNTEFVDHGNWHTAEDGKILVLEGRRGAREQFSLRVADTLRKLDADGQEIHSQFNYDLKRSSTFAPIESQIDTGAAATLENTDWKLVSAGDAPIHSASEQGEPHLLLSSDSHRVSGSGGCNRLVGSYELSGNQITFTKMAGTMMACVSGMDTEKAMQDALARTKTWKIEGRSLVLLDENSRILARFDAR